MKFKVGDKIRIIDTWYASTYGYGPHTVVTTYYGGMIAVSFEGDILYLSEREATLFDPNHDVKNLGYSEEDLDRIEKLNHEI